MYFVAVLTYILVADRRCVSVMMTWRQRKRADPDNLNLYTVRQPPAYDTAPSR